MGAHAILMCLMIGRGKTAASTSTYHTVCYCTSSCRCQHSMQPYVRQSTEKTILSRFRENSRKITRHLTPTPRMPTATLLPRTNFSNKTESTHRIDKCFRNCSSFLISHDLANDGSNRARLAIDRSDKLTGLPACLTVTCSQ